MSKLPGTVSMKVRRREFLVGSGGLFAAGAVQASNTETNLHNCDTSESVATSGSNRHTFNGSYEGEHLARIAFPLGGMGAGMICLDGRGALTQPSLRHRPELESEPLVFAALSVRGEREFVRVLEGPMPQWHRTSAIFQPPDSGFPRLRKLTFNARFPFASVSMSDPDSPVDIELTAWSPFEPGDADNSSLPVAALEYTFTNRSPGTLEGTFSFNASNFMIFSESVKDDAIRETPQGFVLYSGRDSDSPWDEGHFAVWTDDPATKVDHAWRGTGWPASMYMLWQNVRQGGRQGYRPPQESAPGASLYIPLVLAPGASKTVVLKMAWYVGRSNLCIPGGEDFGNIKGAQNTYRPWYVDRFTNLAGVIDYWNARYTTLKANARRFSDCFFSSTLPPEVLEAVAANFSTLKSPTVLRQTDGRVWGWEGSFPTEGSCPGTCTHVWNFAQSMAHLFPGLERGLRETEFGANQSDDGHQVFRAALPIRPPAPRTRFVGAADGQLGGVIKLYREWRISGDLHWMSKMWPSVRQSMDYSIRTWDPRHRGWLEEPQYNTYDSWFWGPNGRCTSIYLGALQAAIEFGRAVQANVSLYETLLSRGMKRLENDLFDGEYFFQRIEWRNLDAKYPEFVQSLMPPLPEEKVQFYGGTAIIPNTREITDKEGPPQQYGSGCLSDGLLGVWMAWTSGLNLSLNVDKIKSHIRAVYRYNFRRNFYENFNPMPRNLACDDESGLVICTWPKGGELSIPISVAGEGGWTGVEYQVASHMISLGLVEEGLEVVRAVRSRYDGRVRNPFAEIELGHWYARAMASYALLQACTGARYDAVDRVLHLAPVIQGDFRCFISTETGYGIVGVREGTPFVDVVSGKIPYTEIRHRRVQT